MCGLVIRKNFSINFSVGQRFQRFVRFVYDFALAMIFILMISNSVELAIRPVNGWRDKHVKDNACSSL